MNIPQVGDCFSDTPFHFGYFTNCEILLTIPCMNFPVGMRGNNKITYYGPIRPKTIGNRFYDAKGYVVKERDSGRAYIYWCYTHYSSYYLKTYTVVVAKDPWNKKAKLWEELNRLLDD